jgi:hypothetical protein
MLGSGAGSHQESRHEGEKAAHQNLTLMPAVAANGGPMAGMAEAFTVILERR